jgi:carboxypeptidase Taq
VTLLERDLYVKKQSGDTAMAADVQRAYETLIRRARELNLLASCSALLEWDEQTYMPVGGSAHRGEQMGHLAGLHHERATDPQIGDLLAIAEGSDLAADPDTDSAVNIREIRRSYDRRTKLPRNLVEALARTTSLAQQEWIAARHDATFGRFRPWLEKILHLKREEGACLSKIANAENEDSGSTNARSSVYDPLLDEYEPGARSAELVVLFRALREELVPLAQAIGEASAKRARDEGGSPSGIAWRGDAILKRVYPLDRQKFFGESVASAVGFDFQKGRLDVTAHPFCTGIGPGDTRITTRYDEHQFGDAFFGILHEVGHGLYEQGLPVEHFGTPIGAAVSLGVHESQSRLWENAVGRSRAFWAYWFPLARSVFHQALQDVNLDKFLVAINHVAPSLIRIQADEVTYNLHIIIRFELEQALLDDELATADLPDAWYQKYDEMLGVSPSSDAEGCLQDIHWSAGLFGYFPTYTLGNLYAAQLFAKARTDLAALDRSFARGDFGELLAWLRHNVHRHGQRYRPVTLIERATGAKPDHRCLITALKQKYGELYRV